MEQSFFSPEQSNRNKERGILVKEKVSFKKSIVFNSIGSESRHRSQSLLSRNSAISAKNNSSQSDEPSSSSSECQPDEEPGVSSGRKIDSKEPQNSGPMGFLDSDHELSPIKAARLSSKQQSFENLSLFNQALTQKKSPSSIGVKLMDIDQIYVSEEKESAKSKEIKKNTVTTRDGDSYGLIIPEIQLNDLKNTKGGLPLPLPNKPSLSQNARRDKEPKKSSLATLNQLNRVSKVLKEKNIIMASKMTKDSLIEVLTNCLEEARHSSKFEINQIIQRNFLLEEEVRDLKEKLKKREVFESFFGFNGPFKKAKSYRSKSQSFFNHEATKTKNEVKGPKNQSKWLRSTKNLSVDQSKNSMEIQKSPNDQASACPNPKRNHHALMLSEISENCFSKGPILKGYSSGLLTAKSSKSNRGSSFFAGSKARNAFLQEEPNKKLFQSEIREKTKKIEKTQQNSSTSQKEKTRFSSSYISNLTEICRATQQKQKNDQDLLSFSPENNKKSLLKTQHSYQLQTQSKDGSILNSKGATFWNEPENEIEKRNFLLNFLEKNTPTPESNPKTNQEKHSKNALVSLLGNSPGSGTTKNKQKSNHLIPNIKETLSFCGKKKSFGVYDSVLRNLSKKGEKANSPEKLKGKKAAHHQHFSVSLLGKQISP